MTRCWAECEYTRFTEEGYSLVDCEYYEEDIEYYGGAFSYTLFDESSGVSEDLYEESILCLDETHHEDGYYLSLSSVTLSTFESCGLSIT